MKILYKIICVSALSLFLAGCAKDDTASLQFNIEGAGNREIILSKLSVNRIDVVDTLKTDAGGAARYEAAVAADAPEFFYVSYNRKRLASLIVKGGDKITVNVDTLGSSLTVKGSDESVLLSEIEKEMVNVFAAVGNFSLHPDMDEVEEGRFWEIKEIEENFGKSVFTPNFEKEFSMIGGRLVALL